MTRTIFIAAGLALSTNAASQEFSLTPGIDILAETTVLQLRPAAAPDQSNIRLFDWDSDAPFWIALGTAVLTTTVILVGVHASENGRNNPSEQTP
jgi:hypothetical protein